MKCLSSPRNNIVLGFVDSLFTYVLVCVQTVQVGLLNVSRSLHLLLPQTQGRSHINITVESARVRFTTRCRALTAGLSLTLNLTTNSTIPVSQPLSCVSLSCANLSLSLTLQISQWSSSIETTSSDYRFSGVNRELQVLNVSGFIKFKSKHQSFSQADHI